MLALKLVYKKKNYSRPNLKVENYNLVVDMRNAKEESKAIANTSFCIMDNGIKQFNN